MDIFDFSTKYSAYFIIYFSGLLLLFHRCFHSTIFLIKKSSFVDL